jgi:hypothetical protein
MQVPIPVGEPTDQVRLYTMARSYAVHRGGSSAEFSHSIEQYKLRAKLSNSPDP